MGKARPATTVLIVAWIAAGLLAPSAYATELRQATIDAFNHYVSLTEKRMDDGLNDGNFLYIDSLPADRRSEIYEELRGGEFYIEQLHTKENGQSIHIPNGLIHHWIGIAFIPWDDYARVLNVLQDYQKYGQVYKPDVQKSKLLGTNGNHSEVFLQLYKKSLVTVVLNADFDASYRTLSSTRTEFRSYSTRIAELRDPGGPDELELPVGNDHGYLWRLYSYWRVEEKDGGVYMQVESIALSRPIPVAFAWLVSPIVRDLSRAVVANLLNQTIKAATAANAPAALSMLKVAHDWVRLPFPENGAGP